MKKNEKKDKIIIILVIILAIMYIAHVILKPDEESKSINYEITKTNKIEVSSKVIRAKYIEEKTGELLPGTYIRFNPNVTFVIEPINDNQADFYPVDINGFLYNGNYEIFEIDSEENRTTYKEKSYGSHAVLPYQQDKQEDCYEVVFYYDKVEFLQVENEQEIELTDDIINKMPDITELNARIYGTKEKNIKEISQYMIFAIEPEQPINKDVLKYIDKIVYKIDKKTIETEREIAEIIFKINDGKYIFDHWNNISNNVELLSTKNDGQIIFVLFNKNPAEVLYHQIVILKDNVIVPNEDTLKANIIIPDKK